MEIITHEEIVNLKISPEQCIQWTKTMILNKDNSILKPKISMKFGDCNFYNTMPAILPDQGIAGVKVVNRYSDRQPSLDSQILLYDLNTGKLKALLDGNYITAMRTGAVAAYSVKLLAKSDFYRIGFIGLGNTARATFLMLMSLFSERTLVVKLLKHKDQHLNFVSNFQNYSNVSFEFCDSYDQLVSGSDVVISSVTYAGNNFCNDDKYKEGCLAIPIHTRGFQNCDLFFDKVFADDKDHVSQFQYYDKFKEFSELSQVARKEVPGRTNDLQRILAYNIGIAIHDVYFAEQIYKILNFSETVPNLKLNNINEKFWIK